MATSASGATASGASRVAHQRRINATLATIATRQRLIIAVVKQHIAAARVRVRVAVRAWRHLVKRASVQRRRRRRRMRMRMRSGVLASRRQHVIDVQLLRRHAGTQQAVHVTHDVRLALAAAHRQRACDSR